MAVNPGNVSDRFETDLQASVLQRLIDDAEEQLVIRAGARITQTDEVLGKDKFLFPSRPVKTMTTVTETVGDTDTVLASNDFLLRHSGRQIERLDTGTNARSSWGKRVKLEYAPLDDGKRRDRVVEDLVILAIQFDGLQSQKVGDYSQASADYQKERERLISSLSLVLA